MSNQIDQINKRIIPLERTDFATEGLKEVEDIEEWIMKQSDILAEEDE